MPLDLDVEFARDAWKAGRWSPWEVCQSIAAQWGDKHVADLPGDDVNAHSLADVAVFIEAAAACAAEAAAWMVKGAALAAGLLK